MSRVRMPSLKQALLGLAALVLLALLVLNARGVDHGFHARVDYHVVKLQELETRLDRLVIELRSGLQGNYDGLVATLAALHRHQLALQKGDDAIAGKGDAGIDAAMLAHSENLARLEDLVDRFKSRNALLRNSLHYLPLSVDELARDRGLPETVRGQAESLLRDLLQLKIAGDDAGGNEVPRKLQALVEEQALRPRESLAQVIVHARNVVANTREVGLLMEQISARTNGRLGAPIGQAYDATFDRQIERANLHRLLLCIASLLVVAYAGNLFRKLRENASRLTETARAQEHELAERRKAEERLAYLAQYDSLTGLPNRSLLRDRLGQALARAKRDGRMVALMFLDLDHFKQINDTLGHATGDKVLQAVAMLLRQSLREVDTVARLGGDEFTVILEGITDVAQVEAVADKIRRAFAAPLLAQDGRDIFAGASIGVAMYPRDVDNLDGMLQAADIAMYHAKQEGRDRHEFYAAELNAQAAGQMRMEGLLRRALERGELSLHYQPKVQVSGGRITGVEALLRWNSAELGAVPPAKFIPLAERLGLIVPIGEWVLKAACAQAQAWREHGFGDLAMSVNLSPRQFRDKGLLETVAATLAQTGLPARLLELEITEGMIMEHPDKAIALLEQIHALGVQLSVDDFGTGYSSLAYLKRFPVQKLKIDRSFICDLGREQGDASIVTAIIAMAAGLRVGVVAEGVETREQLEILAQRGCQEYQGYYFSKPLPAAELATILRGSMRARGGAALAAA